MLVVHLHWHDGALHLWAESLESFRALGDGWDVGDRLSAVGGRHEAVAAAQQANSSGGEAAPDAPEAWAAPMVQRHRAAAPPDGPGEGDASPRHPFAAATADLAAAVSARLGPELFAAHTAAEVALRLPTDARGPWPSDRLSSVAGWVQGAADAALQRVAVESLRVEPADALPLLLRLDAVGPGDGLAWGGAARYWMAVGRFAAELLSHQRFIPTLIRGRDGVLHAGWQPWMHDEAMRGRVGLLLAAMPPVVRAVADRDDDQPWPILEEALRAMVDAQVRRVLVEADFPEAIEGRDPQADPHVAWLSGLLDGQATVDPPAEMAVGLMRDAARWVGALDDVAEDAPLRLGMALREPESAALLGDLEPVPPDATWRLQFFLRTMDGQRERIDAEHLWSALSGASGAAAKISPNASEWFLSELARAGRVCPRIEDALNDEAPTALDLTTQEAWEFLREHRPVLSESGFEVIVPSWWDQPAVRLGARLLIEAEDLAEVEAAEATRGRSDAGPRLLGLNSLVRYRWQLAVGDLTLTREEFDHLAQQTSPLVRVRGRWIELRPDDVDRMRRFLAENPGGEMTLLQAIHAAHGTTDNGDANPVFGLDATGWVADLFSASTDGSRMPAIDQPRLFHGELRPYQRTGLSWLAFLDRFGLGACLADDMGLGKTIQLIALLLHEREQAASPESIGPTLLIVPTSVIGNWQREIERFSPSLRVHFHHGPERPDGKAFTAVAQDSDVVITTYALVPRDIDRLRSVRWWRVVLDEAQYIKNPPTKQTSSIRSLPTHRRLALTGTPVENRLRELWSIMEFCNPGYLGTAVEFRQRFAVPIERHRDPHRAEALRSLVQPFVLRRLKTDPKVIDDLPPCFETKEYATLTPEQADLYERTVNAMLDEVDRAEGIQRRGLVLATLVKLKQICNHPAQAAAAESGRSAAAVPERSGKCERLLVLLEEVLASDERALIFTQFRQMGDLLTTMLRGAFDREVLFLHGGTPQAKRQQMIDAFQSPDGEAPIFVLSLRAGGLGLNLTAANHVFHFDRWWNPAVENQATDRAFRIGQTRAVHVHKFVCLGTLEERIDQMIERKTELAEQIVGSGEQWLTELSTTQLHDLLTLRQSAMGGDG